MRNDISLTQNKTAYIAPQLTVFGGVAELTASGSGTDMEATNTMNDNGMITVTCNNGAMSTRC